MVYEVSVYSLIIWVAEWELTFEDWAKQEGLEVVGANFFYAQNEEQW